MGKLKSFVSLKDFYIYNTNDVESKEYDKGCSHLPENSLMGDKVLAQKGYGCPHSDKNNRKPENEHEGVKDNELLHLGRVVLRSKLFKGYPADKGNIGWDKGQYTGGYEGKQPCKKS
jgi:hypothetical protein